MIQGRRPHGVAVVTDVAVGADVCPEKRGDRLLDAVEPPCALLGIVAVEPDEDRFVKIMRDHAAIASS
jgi:hypothetical protein